MANLQATQHADPCSSVDNSIDIPSYISGYFDGEGCFSVAVAPRAGLKVGWEVRPSVSVSQNGDRAQVIEIVSRFFECGFVRPDRSDLTVKWECRRLSDLTAKVLPHFLKRPLLSAKMEDVQRLSSVCALMMDRQHLTPVGLIHVIDLVAGMNPSGTRRYDLEFVRESVSKVKA